MNTKHLLLAICFLFSSLCVKAQIKIGAKGGANFSYITETGDFDFIDWEALTSYYVGAFLEYELSDRLSVRGEALYSFEGAEFRDGMGGIRKVELNYLNVPLLLRLRLIHGIFLDAGIEPGVIINKNEGTARIDKDTEFGFLLGGGFQLGERWIFNLRYVQGLSDIYTFTATDANGEPIGSASGKTRLWQIGAEFSIFK